MAEQKIHIKRRVKRRRVCYFCAEKIGVLDYKDIESFKRFVSDRGKIAPRRNTGVCAKHQRMLAQAVKRARYMALIPHCMD